jgi:hypothetical protein
MRAPSFLSFLPRRSGLFADLAVMALAGLFFAAIGPFDTDTAPLGARFIYWPAVMIAGAFVILAAERALEHSWPRAAGPVRLVLVTLLATPVQTGVVAVTGVLVFGNRPDFGVYLRLLPAVAIVTLVAAAVMEIARRARRRADAAAPAAAGDGEAAPPGPLARYLPARLRRAPLIALQAEDHYVRVHTEAGSDLVLMRFSDALALVENRPGFRLHRSWWAAEAGLEAVHYTRGSGTARLAGGLEAPVSRTWYPALKESGWG